MHAGGAARAAAAPAGEPPAGGGGRPQAKRRVGGRGAAAAPGHAGRSSADHLSPAGDRDGEGESLGREQHADRLRGLQRDVARPGPRARPRPANEPLPRSGKRLERYPAPGVPVGGARGGAVDAGDVALHRSPPRDRQRELQLLRHEPQPRRVLEVGPRPGVGVVVVVAHVEEQRAELDARRCEGVEQVEVAVAGMAAGVGTGVGRPRVGQGAERVDELVPGDHGGRHVGAGPEVDDRDAVTVGPTLSFAAGVRVVDRPVVVDELLLERRAASGDPDRADDAVAATRASSQVGGGVRQPQREDVRLSAAGEERPVEARFAKRVLAAPPVVDRVDVRRDPGAELSAPIGCVRRVGVDDADRPARDGRRPVLRRGRPAPRRRARVLACDTRHDGGGQQRERDANDRRGSDHRAPRIRVPVKRGSVPASRRRMLCRWSARTPRAATAAKPTTGHGTPNTRQRSGSADAVTIEASEA